MNARHRAREVALQILYRYDVALQAKQPVPALGPELARDLEHHFNHFVVPEPLREFAAQLVVGTLTEVTELDALLEKHASHWKVARMGLVDRNLLRMAAYELQRFSDTPSSVVIDEAIELGKQFGTSDTPAFVNGILDAIRAALPSKVAGS
jgi:N utilization substance protein B